MIIYIVMFLLCMAAIGALFIFWGISIERRLVVLEENINRVMSQINFQLSCRNVAVNSLVAITNELARQDSSAFEGIDQVAKSGIKEKPTAEEIELQCRIIADAMGHISMITKIHPNLKEDQEFQKAMDNVKTFESMIFSSCFLYNDNVSKLNRVAKSFPGSLVAYLLGINQRKYIEV